MSIPPGCFSFLKLLKEDDYSKEIRIPHTFVRNHPRKLSRRCVLLDTQANMSWTVKIRRKGWETHRYYMCKGEWSDFVKFYDLKYGDYLLFFLVDQATFQVIPYGADCCQKLKISHESDLSSGDSSYDDDYSSSEESEEDNDEHGVDSRVEHSLERIEPNKKHKVDSRAGPSNRSQSYKKQRIESPAAGPSKRSQNLKTSRNSGTYIDLNAKYPYCIVTLRRHNDSFMTIPRPFARGTQIEEKENVVLRGQDKREWEVEIRHRSGRVDMVKGWPDFYKEYDLKEGDTCKLTQLKVYENVLLSEITRKMHP